MHDPNPFEPPKAIQAFGDTVPEGDDDAWRDGPLLVLRRGRPLPDRCVKCNSPADSRRFLRVLRSVPIDLGLCRKHRQLAWRASLIPSLTGAYGVSATMYLWGTRWVLAGPAIILLGFIVGTIKIRRRTVTLARLDPGFLWLKGAGPDFLDELPDLETQRQDAGLPRDH